MKVLLGTAILISFGLQCGAATEPTVPSQVSVAVTKAEKHRLQIDHELGKYQSSEKMLMDGRKLVGSLRSFSLKGQLRKITVGMSLGPLGRRDYYWWEGSLIAIFEAYRKPKGAPPTAMPPQQFYFDNGTLIRWSGADNESSTKPIEGAMHKKEAEMLAEATRYLAMATSNEQNIDISTFESF